MLEAGNSLGNWEDLSLRPSIMYKCKYVLVLGCLVAPRAHLVQCIENNNNHLTIKRNNARTKGKDRLRAKGLGFRVRFAVVSHARQGTA